jgi:hypothetical protein
MNKKNTLYWLASIIFCFMYVFMLDVFIKPIDAYSYICGVIFVLISNVIILLFRESK